MTDLRIGDPSSRRALEVADGVGGVFTPLLGDAAGLLCLPRDAADPAPLEVGGRRPAPDRAAADLPPGP